MLVSKEKRINSSQTEQLSLYKSSNKQKLYKSNIPVKLNRLAYIKALKSKIILNLEK